MKNGQFEEWSIISIRKALTVKKGVPSDDQALPSAWNLQGRAL
jgi:hypothetical protein